MKVLVTTDKDKRGVFFGELVSEEGATVVLKDAKMAVYWSQNVKGVLGLAATGPLEGCRISPAVPQIKLTGVTSVTNCTDEAISNWGKETWS